MRKKLLLASFMLLIGIALIRIQPVDANATLEFAVVPDPQVISAPGLTNTINITIANSPAVVQWVMNISWNPAYINITNPDTDIVEGAWLKGPTSRSTMFLVKPPEPGLLSEMTCLLMVSGVSEGNGVLCIIRFTGVATGSSEVHIIYGAVLDAVGTEYPAETDDGTINVIPEFLAFILLPVFLTVTAIALATTTAWSRKRRGSISAP
jgi:hypothetical protein